MKLGFLASNNGSAMRAVIAALEAGEIEGKAVLLVANRAQAGALAFARAHGVPVRVIPTAADPAGADRRGAEAFAAAGAEWIVLSGYLRKVGPRMLARWRGRILNIHPALLPAFGGPGMYGARVHEAVAAARPAVTGATVHLVDEEYDRGPALARVEVPVEPGDSASTIQARVNAVESALMVRTLAAISRGELAPVPRHGAISDNLS